MKNLIKLLVASLALVASFNSNATTVNLGNVTPSSGGSVYNFTFPAGGGFPEGGGFFTNKLEFNLISDAYITIEVPDALNAFLFNGISDPINFVTGDNDGLRPALISNLWLAGGFYTVDFKSQGNRLLNGSVTAVPEPETYALMLAGLALVGFSARRRQA